MQLLFSPFYLAPLIAERKHTRPILPVGYRRVFLKSFQRQIGRHKDRKDLGFG